MTTVSVEGVSAVRASLVVPAWGRWYLDAELIDAKDIAEGTAVTCKFAGLTLLGAVASGGAFDGRAAYRIVGGRGKWGDAVPAFSYRNDAGVSLAAIASDVAAACGESVDVSGLGSARTGPHFARLSGPASIVGLSAIAPRSWYVGFDGVTRFGARPSSTYAGAAIRTAVRLSNEVVELAVEDAAGIVPGAVISPLEAPASDIEFTLAEGRITARVYSSGEPVSRRLAAWAWLSEALDPRRAYRACYEFRVINQEGDRYNLQPVRSASKLPELRTVPVRSAAGVKAQVVPGSSVVVAFLDGDPSRPCVIAHDAADSPGWMPTMIQLGPEPRLGVARLTDTVQAGPFAGVITLASATTEAGP